MANFQERCWQNLDKLLLCFLFVLTLASAMWMQFKGTMDESAVDWARHNTDLVLAGLLGLMGGRAWSNYTSTTVDKTSANVEITPPKPE